MYFLVIIAIITYFIVLYLGGLAIFATSADLERSGTSKRQIVRMLYGFFVLELLTLAGLLIPEAFASLLQSHTATP